MEKSMSLIKQGELSYAARVLTSQGLAPGTQATLDELTNPQLRPADPAERIPANLEAFEPADQVELDKDVFATVLRQTRRGLSGGMWGGRYEYFKPCLEDKVAFDALYDVAPATAVPQTLSPFRKQFRRSGNTSGVPETVPPFRKQASPCPETCVKNSGIRLQGSDGFNRHCPFQ